MKKELTYEQLLAKAEDYCARSEHCSAEVMEKLYAWGCTDRKQREQIIQSLEDNNFINTSRYCRAFAHDKLLYQGWGKQKIQMMLRLKHLPEDDIQSALDSIDPEQYDDVLLKILNSKLASLRQDEFAKERLIRFLTQRGFEYDRTVKAVEQVLE